MGLLRQRYEIVTIASGPQDARSLEAAESTFQAMIEGAPIVYQGVLLDPQHRTYGMPDLLVRSDVLAELYPDALAQDEAHHAAPDLGGRGYHYRVVDIKFGTLGLLAGGDLNNAGSAPAYKVQIFIYNQALGRLQGFEPPTSFLLGRGWTQGKDRGSNCLDRLVPVQQAGALPGKRLISGVAAEAIAWVRKTRTEGVKWRVLPEPSTPELYPNASNNEDGPWHHAKKQIVEGLEDLTLLWRVGVPGRRRGHEAGVYRWTDPRVTPEAVGVTNDKRAMMLSDILDVNRTVDGPPVRPSKIRAAQEEWHERPALEFYVDFETVSDLADDFSRMPEKGGQPLIFMIGCGHVEGGEWSFECFVVDALTEPEEARIIDQWLAHMEAVRERLAPDAEAPRLMHWSPAERSNFEDSYNSAKSRQGRSDWPSPRWFDFLRRVMHEEPVVVRGAMAFGLKAVAKAMHSHGLIETLWGEGPTDGLGAMVGAWCCAEEGKRLGVSMAEIDLMQETVRYNEVDCKVMMEIVRYLRQHH